MDSENAMALSWMLGVVPFAGPDGPDLEDIARTFARFR
jgi:hypothetical protein